MVKRLKIPKELPEAVIPRRTDNTMVKRFKIPKELPEAVIPRRLLVTPLVSSNVDHCIVCPSWKYGFW
jgi:hypothetical protein